ncbi:hypothetical protein [uncultured Brevibacterium sp.]|uniref:hypothetical protein n=1 Tax=uncultured Brevibacterium sp. TaxID=189678 RepID=UPI0025E542A8|nr:hypothetical protein [uncultured Brevibacterium sp.]
MTTYIPDDVPPSRALGRVLDLATAGLCAVRTHHVPAKYQPALRFGASLAAGLVAAGSALNTRDICRTSAGTIAGLGTATAALTYATWELSDRLDKAVDRRLRAWGIPAPEVATGLAAFIALRAFSAWEERQESDFGWMAVAGEGYERDLPSDLRDSLTGFAHPELNLTPGAAQALATQIPVLRATIYASSDQEPLKFLDDCYLELTLPSDADVSVITPRTQTYPVYARATFNGVEHRLDLVVHEGHVSALSVADNDAELPSLADWISAYRAGAVEFISEFDEEHTQ